jgi:hypothetical protein
MKISNITLSFLLLVWLFTGCSENPAAPPNNSLPVDSIIIVDEYNDVANYLNLSTGKVSTLIGSAMCAQPSQPIAVLVSGNYAYFVISGTTSAVRKYNLSTGQWAGAVTYTGEEYAQGIASDGNNLYVSFEGTSIMEAISLSSFSSSASVATASLVAEGIFCTNGYVYLCLSGGYNSSYANSCMGAIPVNNLQSNPVYSNVLTNPWAIDSDGAGSLYVSSEGTYNNNGGITKITGSAITSIVQNKSFGCIKYAVGYIYAAEYGNGIDIYTSSGSFNANILTGININSIIYYNGCIYAEGNDTIYAITTTGNIVIQTYNTGINDSWGCAMAVYE